jgi:hypothetical protein
LLMFSLLDEALQIRFVVHSVINVTVGDRPFCDIYSIQ